MCGGEAGHEPVSGGPVGVNFEWFKFLPEAADIVRRDLDSAVVDLEEEVHFLLSFLSSLLSLSGGWVRQIGRLYGRYRERLV